MDVFLDRSNGANSNAPNAIPGIINAPITVNEPEA